MKKSLFLILLLCSTHTIAMGKCYKLKEVMQDEAIGRSTICYMQDVNQCFFTDDKEWYTHTFQIPCEQFDTIERYVKNNSDLKIKSYSSNPLQD
ncbi:hypothetical protein N9948_01945 [bacterium]|nr:hypothetical protein [bacterium]